MLFLLMHPYENRIRFVERFYNLSPVFTSKEEALRYVRTHFPAFTNHISFQLRTIKNPEKFYFPIRMLDVLIFPDNLQSFQRINSKNYCIEGYFKEKIVKIFVTTFNDIPEDADPFEVLFLAIKDIKRRSL